MEMAEMHNDLIEKRKLARDFERDSIQVEESLKREEAINSRLDVQVSSFMERRQYEEKIQWLKRKRACLVSARKRLWIGLLRTKHWPLDGLEVL